MRMRHPSSWQYRSQKLSDPRIEEAPLGIVPRARIYLFLRLSQVGGPCRSPFLLMLFYFLRAARAPLGGGGSEDSGPSSTRRHMQPALRGRRASKRVIWTYGNTCYPGPS